MPEAGPKLPSARARQHRQPGPALTSPQPTSGDTVHWSGDLRPKLIEEIADVMAALRFFNLENLSRAEQESVWVRYNDKLELFREWRDGKDLDSRR